MTRISGTLCVIVTTVVFGLVSSKTSFADDPVTMTYGEIYDAHCDPVLEPEETVTLKKNGVFIFSGTAEEACDWLANQNREKQVKFCVFEGPCGTQQDQNCPPGVGAGICISFTKGNSKHCPCDTPFLGGLLEFFR